jgi:hypothetical protein
MEGRRDEGRKGRKAGREDFLSHFHYLQSPYYKEFSQ